MNQTQNLFGMDWIESFCYSVSINSDSMEISKMN